MSASLGARRVLLCLAVLFVSLGTLLVRAPAHATPVAPTSQCNGNGSSSCYPPSKPRSSVSANRIQEGQSVTYCVDDYHGDANVTLTEKKRYVDTIRTDSDGHGCVSLTPDPGCHHYSATGPDQSGQQVTTGATVCVDSNSTGQSGGGGQVEGGVAAGHSVEGSRLPFTGLVLIPLLAVGVALVVAGALALRSGRARRLG